ncbi:hypothetical protein PVAG01_09227 [Phlyctema vagabunda]|uniref:C2H2-type domain-containing protein n=1 Tax=Phlyctema vagabunda TaxID=108571 RepID=A0ABR4P6R4_9HELO
MCVKEYIGFVCGHCSLPVLHKCPITSQVSTYPACSMPAERPVMTNDYCPACARVVWNWDVLQREEEHRIMHECNSCNCSIKFNLQREYSLHAGHQSRSESAGQGEDQSTGRGKEQDSQDKRNTEDGPTKVDAASPNSPNFYTEAKGRLIAPESDNSEHKSTHTANLATNLSVTHNASSSEVSQIGTIEYAGFRLGSGQPVVYVEELGDRQKKDQGQYQSHRPRPKSHSSTFDENLESRHTNMALCPKLAASTVSSPSEPMATTQVTKSQEQITNVAGGTRFYPSAQEQGNFTISHALGHHNERPLQPQRLGLSISNQAIPRLTHDLPSGNSILARSQKGESHVDNTRGNFDIGLEGIRRGTAITSGTRLRNGRMTSASKHPSHRRKRPNEDRDSKHQKDTIGMGIDSEDGVLGYQHIHARAQEDTSENVSAEGKSNENSAHEQDMQEEDGRRQPLPQPRRPVSV